MDEIEYSREMAVKVTWKKYCGACELKLKLSLCLLSMNAHYLITKESVFAIR